MPIDWTPTLLWTKIVVWIKLICRCFLHCYLQSHSFFQPSYLLYSNIMWGLFDLIWVDNKLPVPLITWGKCCTINTMFQSAEHRTWFLCQVKKMKGDKWLCHRGKSLICSRIKCLIIITPFSQRWGAVRSHLIYRHVSSIFQGARYSRQRAWA